jgi:hypothetical protein
MSDYAFFEYQAKLTNTGHAENEGELVHCMIRMKNVDRNGKRLHDYELHQQAEDDVLFVINPGPHRAINHSSIWNVTEEELHKLEKVSDYHRVGDCEIYFHNADDRSSSPVSGGPRVDGIRDYSLSPRCRMCIKPITGCAGDSLRAKDPLASCRFQHRDLRCCILSGRN